MWSVSPRYSQKCSAHNQFMENDLVSWGLWKARPPIWASLVAQMVKRLPTMRETWVQSLGWEDPLEKETTTHSSILAWRIPWTVHGVTKSRPWLSIFYFAWFWYQGDFSLAEWVWKCSFICNFWKSFRKIGIRSSLNVWQNSPVKPSGPGVLFWGEFLKSQFQFQCL